MKGGRARDPFNRLARAEQDLREDSVAALSDSEVRDYIGDWQPWAHPARRMPQADWRVWLMLTGRGFGKTRTGAEWVHGLALAEPRLRIALVGASIDEARSVMVEGESGLLAIGGGEIRSWFRNSGRLFWKSGARGFLYSGAAPERLRGPEHHIAWCDELAKWARAEDAWHNLMLGMRLGQAPRVLVTTTPRPLPLLRRIMAQPGTVTTRGRTGDNPFLPKEYLGMMRDSYGGTRLGRQELDGELIEDVAGALWTRATIEASRAPLDPSATLRGACARDEGVLKRLVVGVDPPASADGDACGIVVCGLGRDDVGYVLADRSASGLTPEGWARRVAATAEGWGAERVVVESNQGGEMVQSVLRAVDPELPVRPVRARYGKGCRAEPIAILFEQGRVRLAGAFPELEDELCAMTSGGYRGPGSPDRADAMVWALTELMQGKVKAEPRIRLL